MYNTGDHKSINESENINICTCCHTRTTIYVENMHIQNIILVYYGHASHDFRGICTSDTQLYAHRKIQNRLTENTNCNSTEQEIIDFKNQKI